MAGVSIRTNIRDLDIAGRKLDAVLARAGNFEPLLDEIGGYLVFSTQRRFEEGRDPDGARWKPSIRAVRQGGQTLVDQAFLVNSITHSVEPGRVVIGSNLIYAAIHQEGGRAGRNLSVELPARPYLGISAEDDAEIGRILDDHLSEAVQ